MRIHIAALGLPIAVAALAGPPAMASAADRVVTVRTGTGERVNVRAEPSVTSEVIGTRPDGDRVTIICHKTGDRVSGPGGASRRWDLITSGGYVADAYLDTGSEEPVVPACDRASRASSRGSNAPRVHAGFVSYRREPREVPQPHRR